LAHQAFDPVESERTVRETKGSRWSIVKRNIRNIKNENENDNEGQGLRVLDIEEAGVDQ
jgi:hypothetical protein